MRVLYLTMLMSALLISACKPNQPQSQIPELGSIDSSIIAQDTAMQKAIEGSYEYSKSLAASEKLVFDVVAFGGPASKGEYAIIRRADNNKPDTVAHETRYGTIADANITGVSGNDLVTITVVLQTTDSLHKKSTEQFECRKSGRAVKLEEKIK